MLHNFSIGINKLNFSLLIVLSRICYTLGVSEIKMSLTNDEIRHIASLARIALSDEEIDIFRVQLSDILSHFDALQKIKTDSIDPSFHPVSFDTVMRDDDLEDSLPLEEVLKNAPRTEGDLFRIRAVLE